MIKSLCTYTVLCDAGACLHQLALTYHGPAVEGAMLEFVRNGWKRDGVKWLCPKHAAEAKAVA